MIADDRGSQIADRRRSQKELFPYNRDRSRTIAEPTFANITFVDGENADGSLNPGDWRANVQNDESGMVSLGHVGGNRYTTETANRHFDFKEYFNNDGAVEWQYRHVRSCGVVLGRES